MQEALQAMYITAPKSETAMHSEKWSSPAVVQAMQEALWDMGKETMPALM